MNRSKKIAAIKAEMQKMYGPNPARPDIPNVAKNLARYHELFEEMLRLKPTRGEFVTCFPHILMTPDVIYSLWSIKR